MDRPAGELLLKIPLEDTIASVDISSLASQPNEDDTFSSLVQLANGQEERLALEILRRREENEYLTTILPSTHYAVWTMPDDLWEKMATDCLPRCYRETFQATRDRVQDFCRRMMQAKGHVYSKDDFLWAFSMVRSRSVAVPELEPVSSSSSSNNQDFSQVPLALIPGLDLLNHHFEVGAATQLVLVEEGDNGNKQASKKSWMVSSNEPIKAGEQVYLSYGSDKDNWKLLLTYGFAVPNNPNAVVFWSWQDLLDAANKVRPTVFQERVCQQLLRHPQLEAYTTLSEDRASFSYNANQKQPRESLLNGLLMLENLVTQLGQPADDKIGQDVLHELIQQRLQDLQGCQENIQKQTQSMEDSRYKEWIPFWGAMKTAMKQEEKDLT
ncbi:MAG: hypothetical protein SGILL_002706 [Bacillariaceae sp.]